MQNSISKQVLNHLEYLGYKIEDVTKKENIENIDFLVARSDKKSNLLVRISLDNTILFSAKYPLSDSNELVTEKFLKALNILNTASIHTRVYYQENSKKGVDLVIETYVINYNKTTFVMIIDTLENDIRNYLINLSEFYSNTPKTSYGQTIVNELMSDAKEENNPHRIGF